MKIAILTTGQERCGVNEYSQFLYRALAKRNVKVMVWHPGMDKKINVRKFWETNKMDILHVQYQEFYYRGYEFPFDGGDKILFTFHDMCIPAELPAFDIDLAVAHNVRILKAIPKQIRRVLLKPAYPVQPFKVVSFGLGRCDYSLIDKICKKLNISYEALNGSQEWIPQDKLIRKIRESDICVLWYPEERMAGSSFAVRVALGCGRKVIVNDVTWFEDIAHSNLLKVDSAEKLEKLLDGFKRVNICEPSFEDLAEKHLTIYRELLKNGNNFR